MEDIYAAKLLEFYIWVNFYRYVFTLLRAACYNKKVKTERSCRAVLFTIDIGNSYITIGGFAGAELSFVASVVTNPRRTKEQYAIDFKEILALYASESVEVEGAVISSVVPEMTETVMGAVRLLFGIDAMAVGPGVKTGLNITIDNPAQLGADIAATAVAALARFKPPLIICDLGTATAISVIDADKRFLGVVIAAGVGTTLEGFTKTTALLPHVSIEPPVSVVGKNTSASMQSGLVYGTAAMIDGLCDRIENELGESAAVIATGIMTDKIIPCCRRKITVCDHLLLEGLRCIFEKNKR